MGRKAARVRDSSICSRLGAAKMRFTKYASAAHCEPALPKTSATICDFYGRKLDRSRQARVRDLQDENALLTRAVFELKKDLARLQRQLTLP